MRSNRKTAIGSAILLLLLIASLLYPLYGPADYDKKVMIINEAGKVIGSAPFPPSSEHIFGTDRNGQDMLLLLLYGAKFTLITAIVVAFLRVIIGGLVGVFISLWAPWLKKYVNDFFTVFRFVPSTFLGIILMLPVMFHEERQISTVVVYQILMVVLIGIPSVIVFTEELTEELLNKSFITTSLLMGASKFHIIKRHLLPFFRSYGILFTVQQLLTTLQITMHLGIFGFFLGGPTEGGIVGFDEPPKSASLSNEWAGLIGQNLYDFIRAPWTISTTIVLFFLVIQVVNMIKKELEEKMAGLPQLTRMPKLVQTSTRTVGNPGPDQFIFVNEKKSLGS
ncbi:MULTISPECIES: ABC transporter permease subunit [Neobacillus]|uniref:ABC transporter permease subunit n=1 Tax=Neobacillus rhizophilus TaxID=2833579 RepID=A0A942U8R4_9BACI|nr:MULTISPECIES: ABC transporter permease subunit [Neobacillus]MBS4214481.1 ABC transporter permease subunit [Neobacillus rhizophilus]